MVIIEKPIGPQLHAPADAPIIVPVTLLLTFLIFLTILTLKIFMATTIPANIDKIRINRKLNIVLVKTEKTKNGSKNMYPEIIDNGINNPTEMMMAMTT